ncbi:hypothetical protein B0H14DRAFT_2650924 [Mycena olivaceomarginata]|nr:hypothetical protein B0H14DRAFT_2650924 [Mycena olivaceomarginata]
MFRMAWHQRYRRRLAAVSMRFTSGLGIHSWKAAHPIIAANVHVQTGFGILHLKHQVTCPRNPSQMNVLPEAGPTAVAVKDGSRSETLPRLSAEALNGEKRLEKKDRLNTIKMTICTSFAPQGYLVGANHLLFKGAASQSTETDEHIFREVSAHGSTRLKKGALQHKVEEKMATEVR